MTPLDAAALVTIGAFAGAINSVAGGGSLLTIPLLGAVGIAPVEANATNRIGVLMQAVTSTAGFARAGALDTRDLAWLPGSVAGAALGAWIAASMEPRAFETVVGIIFLFAGAALIRSILRAGRTDAPAPRPLPRWFVHIAMFGLGVYGGFVQAGAGVLILLVLHVAGGQSLLRANAVKAASIALWTVLALGVFARAGLVHLAEGLVLGVGGMIGAHQGVRWAARVSQSRLRAALAVACVVAGVTMLADL